MRAHVVVGFHEISDQNFPVEIALPVRESNHIGILHVPLADKTIPELRVTGAFPMATDFVTETWRRGSSTAETNLSSLIPPI